MNNLNKIKVFTVIIILFITSACNIKYSFTGASISPDTRTIQISHFPNRATNVQPTLSNTLTEEMKDRFLNQTSLSLVNIGGDLALEGEITDYKVAPMAYQGNETAALNRLTISIRVRFTNTKDETKNFESNFSRYADFESSKNIATVEGQLISEIVEQLTEDVFNKAVVNW
ncbi:MAG: LptE family protein [Bacteroidales bacterium]|nr:LptE family protein [Bacteroidales bacterium]